MGKTNIGNGFYEITPDQNSDFLIKSQLAASKKMELIEPDSGVYIKKMISEEENVRKLFFPFSYGLATNTYHGNIITTNERIVFEENGEVRITHKNNAIPYLIKEIFYRSDGSIYKRRAILQTSTEQRNFHLEEDGKIYDEKGNCILQSTPNNFEKQSYIDALAARAKFNCMTKEENTKSNLNL